MTAVPARMAQLLEPTSPVYQLAERLAEAGFEAYVVGGSVRDALLDRPSDDIDLCTNARPEQIKTAIGDWADALWLQGEAFGTVGCQKDGLKLEVTTFRAEVYRSDSRKPEVEYSDDIETDLSRRDFTVNAMALQLVPEVRLVDPFNGAADLAAKVLRTPMEPEISFLDDPLRMMRAARFMAGFGLEPVPELVAAVRQHVERMEIVSAERIRDELSKLLVVPDPSLGLYFLSQTGLSDTFLPELNAMSLEQDPIHKHKDVLTHTIAVVANTRPELRVRLAALLHDVGKPKTRAFGENGVQFHHHEVVGARMAEQRMKALRFSNELTEEVKQLVFLHLRIHTYGMGWTDSAVRRYVRDAGPLLDDLNHLQRCDCTTRNKAKAKMLQGRMDDLEARIAALRAQEELDAIRPPLDGKQVMDHLGLAPGREVGEALAFLLELRLEEGPIDEADAFVRLDSWAAERGIDAPGR